LSLVRIIAYFVKKTNVFFLSNYLEYLKKSLVTWPVPSFLIFNICSIGTDPPEFINNLFICETNALRKCDKNSHTKIIKRCTLSVFPCFCIHKCIYFDILLLFVFVCHNFTETDVHNKRSFKWVAIDLNMLLAVNHTDQKLVV